jgi:acetylglutamate synthase
VEAHAVVNPAPRPPNLLTEFRAVSPFPPSFRRVASVESRAASTSSPRLQLQLAFQPAGTQTPTLKRATIEAECFSRAGEASLPSLDGHRSAAALTGGYAPSPSATASWPLAADAARYAAPTTPAHPLTARTAAANFAESVALASASSASSSQPIPAASTRGDRTLITQLLGHFKQTSEVRSYLKYYGRVDGDRFAVVKLSGDVLSSPQETARVAASLAFLHRIGLVPIVVHGAGLFTGRHAGPVSEAAASTDSKPSATALLRAAEEHMIRSNASLVEALRREGIESIPFVDGVFGADVDTEYEGDLAGTVGRIRDVDVDAITSAISSGRIPIVAAMGGDGDKLFTFPTHEAAIALAKMVQPLKVIWLRPEGGLRTSDGDVIRSVDLARDAPQLIARLADDDAAATDGSADLLDSGSSATAELYEAERAAKAEACVEELDLSPSDADSLVELASFHEVLTEPGATVSVTTPEMLAEELFTHKGSGTLITRGERVFVHSTLDTVDLPRLYSLIGAAFRMPLPEGYLEGLAASGRLKRVYVTEEYRGAAIVLSADGMGTGVGYLDKFAVDPSAQGDKLGEVLWRAMVSRERKLFWRSRSSNRVNPWYYEQSDGCFKASGSSKRDGAATGQWTVFWRGLADEEVMPAVDIALSLPPTFPVKAYGDARLRGFSDSSGAPPGIPTLK